MGAYYESGKVSNAFYVLTHCSSKQRTDETQEDNSPAKVIQPVIRALELKLSFL